MKVLVITDSLKAVEGVYAENAILRRCICDTKL